MTWLCNQNCFVLRPSGMVPLGEGIVDFPE